MRRLPPFRSLLAAAVVWPLANVPSQSQAHPVSDHQHNGTVLMHTPSGLVEINSSCLALPPLERQSRIDQLEATQTEEDRLRLLAAIDLLKSTPTGAELMRAAERNGTRIFYSDDLEHRLGGFLDRANIIFLNREHSNVPDAIILGHELHHAKRSGERLLGRDAFILRPPHLAERFMIEEEAESFSVQFKITYELAANGYLEPLQHIRRSPILNRLAMLFETAMFNAEPHQSISEGQKIFLDFLKRSGAYAGEYPHQIAMVQEQLSQDSRCLPQATIEPTIAQTAQPVSPTPQRNIRSYNAKRARPTASATRGPNR